MHLSVSFSSPSEASASASGRGGGWAIEGASHATRGAEGLEARRGRFAARRLADALTAPCAPSACPRRASLLGQSARRRDRPTLCRIPAPLLSSSHLLVRSSVASTGVSVPAGAYSGRRATGRCQPRHIARRRSPKQTAAPASAAPVGATVSKWPPTTTAAPASAATA
jgi:hypothetical protein